MEKINVINENIKKARWLSNILLKKLGADYYTTIHDLERIETVFAYIRKDKKKRQDGMKTLIKRSVNLVWLTGKQHHDPYELFIDAGVYSDSTTLQDFTSGNLSND